MSDRTMAQYVKKDLTRIKPCERNNSLLLNSGLDILYFQSTLGTRLNTVTHGRMLMFPYEYTHNSAVSTHYTLL